MTVELRRRVERLLRGERRAEDLTALFLSQREVTHVGPAERELGDFIAHRNGRDRGLSFARSKAMVLALRMNADVKSGIATTQQRAEALRANFGIQTYETLSKELPFGRHHATYRSMLEIAIRKNFSGLTAREEQVVTALSRLASPHVFSKDELIGSFSQTLLRSKLLMDGEINAFTEISDFVSVYAIAQMHRVSFEFGQDSRATIYAHLGGDDVSTWIGTVRPGHMVFYAHFRPQVDLQACCSAEVLAHSSEGPFPHPIEINPEGRLAVLH